MWNDYEYMSWPERILDAGAAILGGIAFFVLFCLSNARVIAIGFLVSLWFSAYWTLEHPKPVATASTSVQHPGHPQP